MIRRRVLPVLALPVLALSMAACGGDESGTATPAPVPTTSAAASSSEAPSSAPASSSAAPSSATSSAAPTSAAAGGSEDPGVAPEGAVIAAGSMDRPPQAVGEWTRLGDDPTLLVYERDLVNISYQLSPTATLESRLEDLEGDSAPAGTGICGSTTGNGPNICYLRAADGLVIVSVANGPELDELVTFANQLTAELGTS